MITKILDFIKVELSEANIQEVPAIEIFSLQDDKPKLFCGSVYGFLAQLTNLEAKNFFNEAKSRRHNNITKFEDFKPIIENVYPIYWGKDKSIGKRAYDHLNDPKGNATISLSTYKTMKENKNIICFTIVVDDNDRFEKYLQNKYPYLLSTYKRK